ncbi:MAG: D-alanyl-D-alanine carboxypeptidase/D-alanyl-D-alanine-endopeptidase [Rhodobacteraceae bacterium]|nr:D-alanyl-D-alanine carboxypeptidase/D-alanyl-D-alanine-endopeptidase [Paracoccaceae bacterium]
MLGGIGAAVLGAPALANAPRVSLRPEARSAALLRRFADGPARIVAAADLSGDVSIAVADVATGRRLEDMNGARSLPPASVTKALTALYALERLGAGHRFQTRLIADGPIRNGILNGDLILAGGGDPTLDTDALADLARLAKAAGLRELRGKFIVFDGAMPYTRAIDAAQPDHVGYSPAVSGIALNFNRVHFEWKRAGGGYSVQMDARSSRLRPDVEMARMRVVARDLPVYTYADKGGRDEWTVAARALGNGGARWLPVRRPAAYAGDVFRTLARSNGIVLPEARTQGTLPTGGTVIAQHDSPPLREILQAMLRYSTNITAEMVGLAATAVAGSAPASLKASARAMSGWARQTYGMTATDLVDHSGLGDRSRMSAFDLVDALVQVRRSGVLRPILKPFVMRDARWRPVPQHPIKVDAKTGTLNFVSGLGGFMTAADGTEMAFAIFTADTAIRARIMRSDREVPQGARTWNGKSKRMQQALIERWGAIYGS